jgi:hypothetical protein
MGGARDSGGDAHAAILKRPLQVALFIQKGIAIEGIPQQLQLNPVNTVAIIPAVRRPRIINGKAKVSIFRVPPK